MRSMVAAPDDKDLSNKEKEHTYTYSTERKKKNDGEIKKTAKRVTDSTLMCYGAMVGKLNRVWPFKANPSRNSAYRTYITINQAENRSKSKTRKTRLNYPERCR